MRGIPLNNALKWRASHEEYLGDSERIFIELIEYFVDITPLHKEQALLYPLIIKTLMLFYNTMEKQGIKYRVIIPEQITCELDSGQMIKVLVHLVRNAVEAMETGGYLEIEVANDAEYIRIAVRDSGMGIAGADLQRVSDPFYSTKMSGTGIGLALVERIIKDHDGKLIIRNRESGGTEVEITLPV
ncbi:MAG: sensor histidine kinase [Candidatus Electrothrix sp. AUS1_2]|nr:sensor histidine kinase [Candidatus Electrothrix sp. AUS1_2]